MSFTKVIKKTLGFPKLILPVELALVTNDYWALLFLSCISLFQPKLFVAVFAYMIFKTQKRVVAPEPILQSHELEHLVLLIHMNHLQSLTEAIEANPQLLYSHYKKKSLLHWCSHYNNAKALMVVSQMTQKYPKEQLSAA